METLKVLNRSLTVKVSDVRSYKKATTASLSEPSVSTSNRLTLDGTNDFKKGDAISVTAEGAKGDELVSIGEVHDIQDKVLKLKSALGTAYQKGAIVAKIEVEETQISFKGDSYDAVVAACFSCVRLALPKDEYGKKLKLALHPVILMPVTFLVFYIQGTALSSLVMDMPLNKTFMDDTWKETFDSPRHEMLFVVKCLMILMLQLISLRKFVGALQSVALALNPYTWTEIDRHMPCWDEMWPSNLWHSRDALQAGAYNLFQNIIKTSWVLASCCLIAKTLQFIIIYTFTLVSMNLILSAENTQEAIFNALAVAFISDLDEVMWFATMTIFHIDEKHFAEHKLSIAPQWMVKTKTNMQQRFTRGRGGSVKIVEHLAIFTVLFFMFLRQFGLLLTAMDTNILPVTRDVCKMYRGETSEQWVPSGRVMLWMVDKSTFLNMELQIRTVVENLKLTEKCLTEDYRTMGILPSWNLFMHYPNTIPLFVTACLAIFVLPQVAYAFNAQLIQLLDDIDKELLLDDGSFLGTDGDGDDPAVTNGATRATSSTPA